MTDSFLYFAYASNLLPQWIHKSGPSAIRRDIGKLENYRLDFGPFSEKWGGCKATIAPYEGRCVWGAIWEIDKSNIPELDIEEGVHQNIYCPIDIQVETPSGKKLNCRSYQLCNIPEYEPELSGERQPSQVYMEVIIKGAKESGIPPSYINELESIPHNGSKGNMNSSVL